MKIGSFNPVQKSEVPELQEFGWLDRVLKPIYDQIRLLTQALSRRLDFEENLNSNLWEGDLVHGQTVSLAHGIRGRPLGVLSVGEGDLKVDLRWNYDGDDRITVTATFDTAPKAAQSVRLLIFGRVS